VAEQAKPRRRGSYGIDAPYAFAFISASSAVVIVACLVIAIVSGDMRKFLPALFVLTIVGFYLHTTLRGKFLVWAELLDSLGLRGDERILDLGCGRGAVLLLAAQHLTTGRAVGLDLVEKRRSIRQFRRGHPAQRHCRSGSGSHRTAHGRHDGAALCRQQL